MAEPVVVDTTKIKYYDSNGNEINPDGTKKSGGVLANILGAIPGILSALFPNGIGGGGSSYPVVTTTPNGTNVNMGGNNNNLFMIILILMVGFLIFTGMNPIKVKK